ncbi:MAG TPA: glycosyltransferase [Polyangia bacterium]|nr:glycosyltransferase [Polyangia bacterium]
MSTLLLVLAAIALLGQLACAWAVAFNYEHAPDLEREPMGPTPPLLVVVPARNEEKNLAPCLEALAASHYPGRLRIRVIDDGSTDRTGEIARALAAADPRIEVKTGAPLPAGWLGKNHALWQGTRGADESFLLFVDADLRVAPEALGRTVAAAERTSADLLTMVPRVTVASFWELCVQPLVAQLIFAAVPTREINQPHKPPASAIGPFLLFRRSAYERIGGHEAVRAQVVEDLKLAEAVKRAGLRLLYGRGIGLASLRMYDSLGGIVRGWSKNFHVAFGRAPWVAPLLAAGLLTVFAGPYLLPWAAAAAQAPAALVVSAAAISVAWWGRLDCARRWGISREKPWLAPLGALVVSWIILRAAWRVLARRPIEWKGRQVR